MRTCVTRAEAVVSEISATTLANRLPSLDSASAGLFANGGNTHWLGLFAGPATSGVTGTHASTRSTFPPNEATTSGMPGNAELVGGTYRL